MINGSLHFSILYYTVNGLGAKEIYTRIASVFAYFVV